MLGCASYWQPNVLINNYKYTNNPKFNGKHKEIPVVIDEAFSKNNKESITKAINMWNYSLNGYMELVIEDVNFNYTPSKIENILNRKGLIISTISSENPIIPHLNEGYILAWVNEIGGNKMWIIKDRLQDEDIYPISLHEIGHALGAEHTPDDTKYEEYLMYHYFSKKHYKCVDADAILKVATVHLLPEDNLNYCYN